ncbi:hypothetical protein ACFSSA_07950 [Luteolibacter algae]|uniref:Uncharacterized protein n=1 Tax=Luteolibacter algae TaxID=454151 RepID=A0ABW5D9H0_9BACT
MKAILLALTLITPAFAVNFDADGFGQQLNGWAKNRTATYEFTDATYRTYVPTITATPGGGMYISTQVDMLAFGSQGAVSHIDMTFDASGVLISAQLRSTIGRKSIDTGLVRRPEAPAAPIAVEGQPTPTAPAFDGTGELIMDLFSRFDIEMKKITEGKDAEKRDLFSRFGGKNAKSVNLAAALRHNVNLMLQHVSPRGYASYK